MFPWFKRPKAPPALKLLKLPDPEFLETVQSGFATSTPAELAMTLFGYENASVLVSVFVKKNEKAPQTIENFAEIMMHWANTATDDINQRRFRWLFLGTLLRIATIRGLCTEEGHDPLAGIWAPFLKGGFFLSRTVQTNILWKPDEKEWFADLKDEMEGVNYVRNLLIPSKIRYHQSINEAYYRIERALQALEGVRLCHTCLHFKEMADYEGEDFLDGLWCATTLPDLAKLPCQITSKTEPIWTDYFAISGPKIMYPKDCPHYQPLPLEFKT